MLAERRLGNTELLSNQLGAYAVFHQVSINLFSEMTFRVL